MFYNFVSKLLKRNYEFFLSTLVTYNIVTVTNPVGGITWREWTLYKF
jgi:hypothetical protein